VESWTYGAMEEGHMESWSAQKFTPWLHMPLDHDPESPSLIGWKLHYSMAPPFHMAD